MATMPTTYNPHFPYNSHTTTMATTCSPHILIAHPQLTTCSPWPPPCTPQLTHDFHTITHRPYAIHMHLMATTYSP